MDNLEFNKIFAAILVAGIVAMLAGFVADHLVHPHKMEKHAYTIEGADEEGGVQIAATPTGPEPILSLIAGANVERGAKLSKACATCHSFEKGGANKIGPNLWNIINRDKGSAAGFSYSSAMQESEGNWNYDALNHFLWKPKSYISGTKMNFVGLRKAQDRADMIAWMRIMAANPAALPVAPASAE